MFYQGGRGVVPPAGVFNYSIRRVFPLTRVCPGKMIVKFRGWPRDMDMCEDVSVTEPPIKKRLAEFQQVFKFVLGTGIEPILQD